MSTIGRTIQNILKVGPANAWRQMQYIGDIKAGTLIGTDKLGNKYFENLEEIYGRQRWVEYVSNSPDPSQITSEWHAWMHYVVQDPPTVENLVQPKFAIPFEENPTGTRRAYRCYSTTKPKIQAWNYGAARSE